MNVFSLQEIMLDRLASMLNFAMMQIVNEFHLSKTLHWREVRGRGWLGHPRGIWETLEEAGR
jgi:hypothetical protein